MKRALEFERQLDSFGQEAANIASYVYAEMALHQALAVSSKALAAVNRTPLLWRTIYGALQSSTYISLGRVFDLDSSYNIEALLAAMQRNLDIFSRTSLEKRKAASGLSDTFQLQRYIATAHILDENDIRRIRRAVARRRLVYEQAMKPARNRHLAHREKRGAAVQALYAKATAGEMWRLSCFLCQLHQSLFDLYHNGQRPNLRLRMRYSPRVMYRSQGKATMPHERIVRDVRTLTNILERGI